MKDEEDEQGSEPDTQKWRLRIETRLGSAILRFQRFHHHPPPLLLLLLLHVRFDAQEQGAAEEEEGSPRRRIRTGPSQPQAPLNLCARARVRDSEQSLTNVSTVWEPLFYFI